MPDLRTLGGPSNFQARLDLFAPYWAKWREEADCMWLGIHRKNSEPLTCSCRHLSFDLYCQEFDQVLDQFERVILTRELLLKLIGCNRFYGMDGITYDSDGKELGEEFVVVNISLDSHPVHVEYLSNFNQFQYNR